jgi:hypothetical protein
MRLRIGRCRPVGQTGLDRGAGQGAWLGLSVALALTVTVGHAVPCRAAGLVIEAPDLTAASGSSGSFDVLLVNTNPAGGISYHIAADSFQLSLSSSAPHDTFTDVSINTITPYIYVTSGTTEGGGPLSLDTFPNTQFTASDSEFADSGFRTVDPGDTFGLAHVSYALSPEHAQFDFMSFGSLATSLSDEDGNAIPFTISNGGIQVEPVIPIPEPSALTEAATAALIGLASLWWRWRGRRAAARY